jgi:hypothetical protein
MRSCLPSAVVFCLLAAGCGEPNQEIKTYRVAKPNDVKAPDGKSGPAVDTGGPYRILGAMFPADDPQWFFKVTGKADELAAVEKEFDTFLATVRFPNGPKNPPLYDLPAGWTSAGKSGMRADTLKFGPGGKFEMSVIASVGGVDGNLARWAEQQLGTTVDKAKQTREVTTASGAKGLRVDMTGPKNPAGAMGGPFSGGQK